MHGSGQHVAVEGLDGSGKSTLIAGLLDRLAADWETREFRLPDAEVFGGHDLLSVLGGAQEPPSAEVLALGFAANRLASYERHISPWLTKGTDRLALSHRYVLSGLAYQSVDGVPLPWLMALNERVPRPDLTIFLDTEPSVCAGRIVRRERAELFENRFGRTREAFLTAIDAMTRSGWRIEILDGSAAPAELVDQAARAVTGRDYSGIRPG